MNLKILSRLLCAFLLAGCVGQPTQNTNNDTDNIRDDIWCTCGCGFSLGECELNDPACKIRGAIEERIDALAEEGYTPEDIVEYFRGTGFLSVEELRQQIKAELESGRPIILYFYSETCSTCINLKPRIEEIEQHFPHITLFKIEKHIHDALFSEYNVDAYPLLIVITDKNEYRKQISEHDDVLSFVRDHLN